MLMSIITDELQRHFVKHTAVTLNNHSALQDIMALSSDRSRLSGAAAGMPCKDVKQEDEEREVFERGIAEANCREQPAPVRLQPLTGSRASPPAAQADSGAACHPQRAPPRTCAIPLDCSESNSSSSSIADGSRSLHWDFEDAQTSNALARASQSAAAARVCAFQGPEPVLAAWQACGSPLDIRQAQEVACPVCRRAISTTVSSTVAIPLVLPVIQVSSYLVLVSDQQSLHCCGLGNGTMAWPSTEAACTS